MQTHVDLRHSSIYVAALTAPLASQDTATDMGAATRVQAARRGQQSRRKIWREASAASRVQAARRGQQSRRQLRMEASAATTLQARYRGQCIRRHGVASAAGEPFCGQLELEHELLTMSIDRRGLVAVATRDSTEAVATIDELTEALQEATMGKRLAEARELEMEHCSSPC